MCSYTHMAILSQDLNRRLRQLGREHHDLKGVSAQSAKKEKLTLK
jgi:hypothetical protein